MVLSLPYQQHIIKALSLVFSTYFHFFTFAPILLLEFDVIHVKKNIQLCTFFHNCSIHSTFLFSCPGSVDIPGLPTLFASQVEGPLFFKDLPALTSCYSIATRYVYYQTKRGPNYPLESFDTQNELKAGYFCQSHYL